MKATIELNSYDACRTNTGRARTNYPHYDINILAKISGANIEDCIASLQYCAEHKDDEEALFIIKRFANALLSTYEMQRNTY